MNAAALLALALATLVSEDLTCLAAGLLVAAGGLDLATALAGCAVGIYVGDLGLWAVGRLAGAWALRDTARLRGLREWLTRHGGYALLGARFLPGTRLPLYLLCGLTDRGPWRFARWTLLAVLIWVPLVVVPVALLGEAAAAPLRWALGGGLLTLTAAVLLGWLLLRVALLSLTPTGRSQLAARVALLWRWEFWPAWLFYLPLVPYLAWLSLRHRGVAVWTAANPGIDAGGVVGESKAAILAALPAEAIIPFALLPEGPHAERVNELRRAVAEHGWAFPLILKPDAGQRGAGVRKATDWGDAERYLADYAGPVLAQPYHAGPHEVGVFYYRLPGEEKGHILALTDKVFPLLEGDGRSTVEELIWRHPRYRMQADVFLARHAARRGQVLAEGETMPLALAGNHCQGTLFRDGARLWSPELAEAIDRIARHFPGFFIGRFDIRYADEAALRAGRELAIVELNGATSEATSLYDPERSLISAYRLLFRQWSLLYRIGAANRDRGQRPLTARGLWRLVRDYYRGRRAAALAD